MCAGLLVHPKNKLNGRPTDMTRHHKKNIYLAAAIIALLIALGCLNRYDELQPINMTAESCAAPGARC